MRHSRLRSPANHKKAARGQFLLMPISAEPGTGLRTGRPTTTLIPMRSFPAKRHGPSHRHSIIVTVWAALAFFPLSSHAEQQRYDHGDPTAGEQYLLELVNTARANPSAEAMRLGIGLNDGLDPGTITTNAKAPLAFHPKLLAAARAHSDWMLLTGVFDHIGVNGTTPTQRAEREGYNFGVAENIGYRTTNSSIGFAALTAMVRETHDALFRSFGHRRNLLGNSYSVAGFGTRTNSFRGDNAAMTTQNFSEGGATFDSGPFITGVAYEDRNDNNSYDAGEGLAGVEVRPGSGGYYAVTSSSGGYAIPVTAVQTNSLTVDLPFAVNTTPWNDVLPHDEAFRLEQLNAAATMTMPLTWSGGALPAPVTNVLSMTRPARVNYRLRGTDGFFYDRTMVTARSVRADLNLASLPPVDPGTPTPTPTPALATQVVTFSPLASVVYAPGRSVRPQARASSGLDLVFSVRPADAAVAEVQGGRIVVRGAGTATIYATQGGNAAYQQAQAERLFSVKKARQTIRFPAFVRPPFSPGASFSLSASATSGGPVTYTADPAGIVSITGSTATMISAGKVKITASQAGTQNHHPASVPKTVVIR